MSTILPEVEPIGYVEEELAPFEENNAPNLRVHIVNPPRNTHIWKSGMTSKDIVDIARINQIEITALCGYKFVPKHNPDKYDACEECIKIAGAIMRGMGE